MKTQEFEFLTATIKSDIYSTEFDVRSSVIELNIFENISRPYLTGKVLFSDTNSFFNNINFSGTEEFEIQVTQKDLKKSTLTKTFIMTKIEKSHRVNDTTEVFLFDLIEKIAFESAAEKISKAYTGTPLSIIQHILSDLNSDIKLDRSLLNADPVQEEMRLITPYIQPLQAVDWIKDRATTANGYPFFVFASMKSEGVVVNSLENILNTPSWNSKPFVYSQGATNQDNPVHSLYTVNNISATNVDDTLNTIMSGAISSRYEVLDLYSLSRNSDKARLYKLSKTLDANATDGKNAIVNSKLNVKNKTVEDLESRAFFSVISSNLFNDDINGYHDTTDLDNLSTKIAQRSIRAALKRNMMNIELSGIPFLISDVASVGTRINLSFIGNQNRPDKKRSGAYTIMALRHQFKDTSYSVAGQVTKLINDGEQA